ncbi:MAG: hypothetical protein ABR980_12050 [Ignavibacteriaceae bacterium]
MKFSERIGIAKPATEIQLKSMNDDLRNSLWNFIAVILDNHVLNTYQLLKKYYINYYKLSIDKLPRDSGSCRIELRERFYKCEWFEVYNFLEFTMKNQESLLGIVNATINFEEDLNKILSIELSGYRSINYEIVPIIEEAEIISIRDAMTNSDKYGLNGVKIHFSNSLKLIGEKPLGDYKNSIKESISAVESICKILANEKSGGLEKALTKIDEKLKLHSALKKGLLNLYGYTSDENGIRHANIDDSEVGYPEASFMLVACAAFVNYIITKSIEKSIL